MAARSDRPTDFVIPALRQLARGPALAEFSAWFADRFGTAFVPGALARFPQPEAAMAEARRAAIVLARQLWRLTPDPARDWRARELPQPGRNDPCLCGSGRKYKQCCQPMEASLPKIDLEPQSMAALLFAQGPAAWRSPAALRRMPGPMLAAAAHGWAEARGSGAMVRLIEPLFLAPPGFGDGHDHAFDLLQDAMQQTGLDARREKVARAVAEQATGKGLRCSARCRLAAMASDRGDTALAWDEFRRAQRESADSPEVLHLELTLLLSEGRTQEARARGPMLAARARRLGYPDLAEMLSRLAEEGWAAMRHVTDDGDALDEEQRDWLALLREPLAMLDAQRFAQANAVACEGTGDEAQLRVAAAPGVGRQLKSWRSRFAVMQPQLTSLEGDAEALLQDAQAARAWLQARPECAVAAPVLDDLLLAARGMAARSDNLVLAEAARELAFAAAAMIVASLEPWPRALLPWSVLENRPVLRIVSQAIDRALSVRDPRAGAWMRWMLARNPHDNHGWREMLRAQALREGDGAGALALLDAYPHDMPPSEHDRALALFLLGRAEEAEAVLREAHARHPAFVAALLPDTLDRPRGGRDGFVAVGGADHAWQWRGGMRDAWARADALAWVRALKLPRRPAAPRQANPKAVLPPAAAPRPKRVRASAGGVQHDPLPVLRQHYGARLPWVLGHLAGCAWAPGLVMPTMWIGDVLEQAQGKAGARAMQALLDALMAQYNAFNLQRLDAAPDAAVPLPDAIAPHDDAGWAAFAAGFVQAAENSGRGAWRAAGLAVSARAGPFAPLYQLAALATAQPDGWRAMDADGQPLLALAVQPEPARELLAHALMPMWRKAVAARG